MTKSLAILVLTAVVAVAAVAGSASGQTATAAAKSATVAVSDGLFVPDKLTVKKGTKVTWQWQSSFLPHNVTVKSGPVKFHSKTQSSGSYSKVLTKPGVYHIVSTTDVRLGMKMTLTVKK